jgi:hypoxanthine-DNA glycosylase
MKDHITHPIPPFYDRNSNILILGSFPSVKSREQMFFYGHPQNRFWKVTASVFDSERPETIAEKKAFLKKNHIALWDVIGSCDIEGSSDSSIENVVANDISVILNHAKIRGIFVNGKTAEKYYKKYIEPKTKIEAVCLPSTSPANAAWSVDRLVTYWKEAIKHGEITDSPTDRIYEAVRKIPKGKVATYAQIAEMAGDRRMARAVGNALHKNPDPENIPCHRVVNSGGELAERYAFGGARKQAEILRREGVESVNGKVDLKKYLYGN